MIFLHLYHRIILCITYQNMYLLKYVLKKQTSLSYKTSSIFNSEIFLQKLQNHNFATFLLTSKTVQ